jgi:heme A synthase
VSPTAHVLLRLRVLHPLLAVVMGLSLLLVAVRIVLRDATSPAATMARTAGVLVMMQLALGIVNLVLLAPTALQLVHLLLADLVWIAAVLLTAALASEPARAVALRPGLDAAAVLQR